MRGKDVARRACGVEVLWGGGASQDLAARGGEPRAGFPRPSVAEGPVYTVSPRIPSCLLVSLPAPPHTRQLGNNPRW